MSAAPPPVFHYLSISLGLTPAHLSHSHVSQLAAARVSLSWLGRRQRVHVCVWLYVEYACMWETVACWNLRTSRKPVLCAIAYLQSQVPVVPGMVLHQAIQAARAGDLTALRELASSGQLSSAITDVQGAGPVHHAARCGRLECLHFLVSEVGLAADARALNRATPAHDAAATGHTRELQWLVDQGGCNIEVSLAIGSRALTSLSCGFQWPKVCVIAIQIQDLALDSNPTSPRNSRITSLLLWKVLCRVQLITSYGFDLLVVL